MAKPPVIIIDGETECKIVYKASVAVIGTIDRSDPDLLRVKSSKGETLIAKSAVEEVKPSSLNDDR